MKRSTKLLLILTSLTVFGLSGIVLTKIQQISGAPFPGAVVVLDDASWWMRRFPGGDDSWYLWANADTILYLQKSGDRMRAVRRKRLPGGTVSSPEILSPMLREDQYLHCLSPDGERLCIWTHTNNEQDIYTVVPTNGKGTAQVFREAVFPFQWHSDSNSLYGISTLDSQQFLKRLDPQTGTVETTPLKTQIVIEIKTITPEGRILGFHEELVKQKGSCLAQWSVYEVKDNRVITTKYQRRFASTWVSPSLSPDGRQLMWVITREEMTWQEKFQKFVLKKKIVPREVYHYVISEIDGSNEREIGQLSENRWQDTGNWPDWTPDGKGVHFLQDGKLMYLAVP